MVVAIRETLYASARRLAWLGRFWRGFCGLWVVGGLILRQGTSILTTVWYRIGLPPLINMRDMLLKL